jgi:hypothetical protein
MATDKLNHLECNEILIVRIKKARRHSRNCWKVIYCGVKILYENYIYERQVIFFLVACLTFILPVYMVGHNILQNTKVKYIVTINLKHETDFMQAYCVFVTCSRYFSVWN